MKASVKKMDVAGPLRFNLQFHSELNEPEEENESTEQVETVEDSERDFEKDSAFAKIRREKEEFENKLKELESKQKETDEWYANNYSELGITTESEYREYVRKQEEENRKRELAEKLQYSDNPLNELDELIKDHPSFKEATQKLNALEKKAQQEVAKQVLQKELEELNSEFETGVETIDEIGNLENGEEVLKYANTKLPDGHYMSLKDAFFMANKDSIISGTYEKAVKQATIMKNSKSHVKPNKGGIDSPIDMPSETLQAYRDMFPNKSDAEFIEHWKKSNQK